MARVARSLLCLFLSLALASTAGAQGAPPPAPDGASHSGGPRKQLATIIFAGLGGAILGLSTLSFYGRPQDKLSNIAIGFAFGIISGTTYVTFRAARDPNELYGSTRPKIDIDQNNLVNRTPPVSAPIHFAFEF